MLRWCVIAVFCLSSLGAFAGEGQALLENYLDGLNSLSSEFRQLTLRTDDESMYEATGRLYLLRPGRMRWEYDPPHPQLIIADGRRVYVHDQELNQVSHRNQAAALDGTPAQLLAGNEPIDQHFIINELDPNTLAQGMWDDRVWVELRPKAEDSQIVSIKIGFMDEQLDTLLMEDRFGQLTRLMLTQIERNPKLDRALFRFKEPIGGDFLRMD